MGSKTNHITVLQLFRVIIAVNRYLTKWTIIVYIIHLGLNFLKSRTLIPKYNIHTHIIIKWKSRFKSRILTSYLLFRPYKWACFPSEELKLFMSRSQCSSCCQIQWHLPVLILHVLLTTFNTVDSTHFSQTSSSLNFHENMYFWF